MATIWRTRSHTHLMPMAFELRDLRAGLWWDARYGVVTHGSRIFDGTDQRFTAGSAINPGTSDFHVSGWMYTPSAPVATGYIIMTGANANGTDGFAVIQPSTSSGATLQLYFNDSVQGSRLVSDASAAVISLRTWTHVAVNFDRSGNATLHVNGSATPAITLDISSHAGSLGAANNGLFGALSDGASPSNAAVCCWGYGTGLLSAADMVTLYNRGVPLRYTELSADVAAKFTHYWNFDETAVDASAVDAAADNDLTIAGTSGNLLTFASPQRLAPVDGLPVGNWWCHPSSGTGFTYSHTAASRPLYSASQRGVVFNGTANVLASVPNLFTGSACEGAVVFTTGSTAFAGREQSLFSFTNATLANRYGHVGIDENGLLFVETNLNGTITRVTGSSSLLTETTYGLSWDSDDSAWSMRLIGAEADETLAVTGSNSGNWAGSLGALTACSLGRLSTSGGSSKFFEGTIHQLIVATEDKTAPMETRLRSKLKGLYSLSALIGFLLADGTGFLLADSTGLTG